MKLTEFKQVLGQNPGKTIHFVLPTGTKIPIHTHITEVARVEKRFIDCGGTIRTETLCRFQTWFADDTEHRIGTGMLLKVLEKAEPVLGKEDLEMDVEFEAPYVSQFPINSIEASGDVVTVQLGTRHTACLAQDICFPPAAKKESVLFQRLPTLEKTRCC